MTDKDLITYNEAAEFTGLKVRTLYNYVARLAIPFFKSKKGRVYFSKSELREWMGHTHFDASETIDSRAEIQTV